MKLQIAILFIAATISTGQKPLPKYIEACKRNDPNLNECFAKSANRAIVQMVKGDAEYGIPSLMPLKYPFDVDFNAPGLKLSLVNIDIHGAANLRVVNPQIDLENKLIKFYFESPMIIWEGDYIAQVETPSKIDQKEGHVNLNFAKGKFLMTYQFALENRNGTDYAKIILAREEVISVDLNIQANNGVNGLTDEEWNVLKEHIINDDFLLICAKTIGFFIKAIFDVVPYNDVFPL